MIIVITHTWGSIFVHSCWNVSLRNEVETSLRLGILQFGRSSFTVRQKEGDSTTMNARLFTYTHSVIAFATHSFPVFGYKKQRLSSPTRTHSGEGILMVSTKALSHGVVDRYWHEPMLLGHCPQRQYCTLCIFGCSIFLHHPWLCRESTSTQGLVTHFGGKKTWGLRRREEKTRPLMVKKLFWPKKVYSPKKTAKKEFKKHLPALSVNTPLHGSPAHGPVMLNLFDRLSFLVLFTWHCF